LQKKRHSDEFLRTIAHLRPRTNKFGAAFRMRSEMSYAIHKFFRHDPSLISRNENIFESRRVLIQPFISTSSTGLSDFRSLTIFVRCMDTSLYGRAGTKQGLAFFVFVGGFAASDFIELS